MFGIFRKKTKKEILQAKYEKLMKEAFELSRINRTEGDRKYSEADEIMKKIEAITKAENG